MTLRLLIDPRAKGAYFDDLFTVALAELQAVFPGCAAEVREHATLATLRLELPERAAAELSRLSFVQGVFAESDQGWRPLEVDPGFALPEALVNATKYRGKTHEVVTRLAINLALATSRVESPTGLLDPMAGRGTTLLYAARYGLDAWGVEQESAALEHFTRDTKRQLKVQRVKHRWSQGATVKKRRRGVGRYVEARFAQGAARLITGDSRDLPQLVQQRRFPLLVSDLPYGVQFHGKGARSPLEVVRECAPGWVESLAPGGALVLIYNRLQPQRESLRSVFTALGLESVPFEGSHRMSESIWRDLLVWRQPSG